MGRRRFWAAMWAIEGGCFGAFVVSIPCAIVWGHHGPDWPLIPLAIVSLVGIVVGWKFGERFERWL